MGLEGASWRFGSLSTPRLSCEAAWLAPTPARASYEVALRCEQHHLGGPGMAGKRLSGMVVDLKKAFDMIPRQFVFDAVLKWTGAERIVGV